MNRGHDGAKEIGAFWFIETKRFTSSWEQLKLKVEDLWGLQDAIKTDPTYYPVISGTGGLRKMRFAARSLGKGKRGSLRVCYAYLPRFAAIVLVLVFAKTDKDDLTSDDKKNVKKWLKELEKEFDRR